MSNVQSWYQRVKRLLHEYSKSTIEYIFNLLLRIINVSIQTVETVKSLPKAKF